jgi:hypothetical protein
VSPRLHWYSIAGRSFSVASGRARPLEALDAILRPFRRLRAQAGCTQHYEIGGGAGNEVRKGRRLLYRGGTLDDVVEFVETDIYAQVVRLLDGDLLFHAGGVVRGDSLLILPAASGSGKTTLVAGLVKRGCLYVTDEILILDPATLAARPLPKPLNLKSGSLRLFPRLAPELRLARPAPRRRSPLRIHHLHVRRASRLVGRLRPQRLAILFPRFRPGGRASLRSLRRVEAIRGLAAASYNHYRFGAAFLAHMERLTRGALCARLQYGRLEEALRLIDRRVLPLGPRARPGASA